MQLTTCLKSTETFFTISLSTGLKRKEKQKVKSIFMQGAWTYKIMEDRMLCNEGSLHSLHSQTYIIYPLSNCFTGRSSAFQFSGEQRCILKLSTKKIAVFFSDYFLQIDFYYFLMKKYFILVYFLSST